MNEDELEIEVRKKLAGYRGETAMMLNDGMVVYRQTAHHADRQPSRVTQELKPDDPSYAKVCKEFGISKPGDSGSKSFKWNGSDWEPAPMPKIDLPAESI